MKPRWPTPLWHRRHWQLDISARIRPTFPATSQSSQTLTPTSKHPWVRIAFHFHVRKKIPSKLEFSFPLFPSFPSLNMTWRGVCVLQTFREPVSEYQVLREKAASQRRDVERALTRFMAKTGETQSLFKDDITTFPRESASVEILASIFTHCSFLLKCVWICVCRQSSQHDPAPFRILVPSCPRNWNCRVWRKLIPLSRTTKQTERTWQGISLL